MEKIGQIISSGTDQGLQESAKRKNKSSRRKYSTDATDMLIGRVWTRMSQIFGHRWVSAYGFLIDDNKELTGTANTWGHALSIHGITESDLKRAFRALLTKEGWPPTLPEFVALCNASKPLASYHRMAKRLPKPEIKQEVISKNLSKIREVLRA